MANSENKPTDFILYYTGHGGFTGNDQAYFLAVQKTRDGSEGATSIRYIDLASTIKRQAGKLRKFLILDCCFAAAAAVRSQSDIGQLQVRRVEEELPQSGTAFLCSSSAKLVSIAPPGERNTMFSGALLGCLRDGIAGAGKTLSLEDVGNRARELIVEKYPGDLVRPELHVPEQALGDPAKVPLFPNPHWIDTIADTAPKKIVDGSVASVTKPPESAGSMKEPLKTEGEISIVSKPAAVDTLVHGNELLFLRYLRYLRPITTAAAAIFSCLFNREYVDSIYSH